MSVVSVYRVFREFVEENGELDDVLSTYSKMVYTYRDYVIVLDTIAERDEDVVVAVHTKDLVPLYYSDMYRLGILAVTDVELPKRLSTPWRLENVLNLFKGEIESVEDVKSLNRFKR